MRPRKQVRKPVLKLLGLAGLAGVAATGAVLARNERQRRAYTADDVRARLHERHATLAPVPDPEPEAASAPWRAHLSSFRSRITRRS